MKLKNKISILAAALCVVALCVLVGCNPAAKFAVVEAPAPVIEGLSALHGNVVVENSGRKALTIENATLTVRYRERELGRARLLQPVEIPPEGVTEVRYDMALEGLSLGSMQTLASRIMSNPDAVTVDVDGWVRLGRRQRKIELRGVELSRFVGIFL